MIGYQATCEELRGVWTAVPVDLVILRKIDSTNRLARSIVRELAEDEIEARRTFFLAWEQTAGRGRLGRRWISPPGVGVYGTLLLPVTPEIATRTLPLLTATALCRSVNGWIDSSCRLKWPNDLLVEGRKIGGILIQASVRSDGTGHAALGFGINYGDPGSGVELPEATALFRETEEPPSFPETVLGLVRGLLRALDHADDPEWCVESFRQLSAHEPGDTMRCRVGEEEVRGRFVRLTEEGSLVLDTGEG
ncbi:MAG: biotin--[acetyl-CoA-carboxylase] ligase, partial [Thermoanaerobaculia bacterium]|nr:biotin--[acetyl-CoA-carboxylase] ligase [Thermoanaerobaculia bacterium]